MDSKFEVGDVIYFKPTNYDCGFIFAKVGEVIEGGYVRLSDDSGKWLFGDDSAWWICDYMKISPDTPQNRLFAQLKYQGQIGAH